MPKAKNRRKFFAPALVEGEVLPLDPANPLKNQLPQLDSFIAQGLAAGKTVPELMAQVLPSIAVQQAAKRERIRADNDAATAKRQAAQAALDDPDKRERERKEFQKRMRSTARKKAARAAKLEREAAEKAQAIADNPTLNWRHPRRAAWAKENAK